MKRFLVLCFVCMLLAGTSCGKIREQDSSGAAKKEAGFVYQPGLFGLQIASSDWLVFYSQGIWYKCRRGSGEYQELFTDPFMKGQEEIKICNIEGDQCYYLQKLNNGILFLDYATKQLDLITGEEKTIYKKQQYSVPGVDLFGIYQEPVWDVHKVEQMEKFAVGDAGWVRRGQIYMLQQGGILEVDVKSGRETQILQDVKDTSFVNLGEIFYYVDNKYRLWKYDPACGKKEQISDRIVETVYGTPGKVLFATVGGELYLYEEKDEQIHLIYGERVRVLQMEGDVFYYTPDEQSVYCADYEMKHITKIYGGEGSVLECTVTGQEAMITLDFGGDLSEARTERIIFSD